MKKDVCLQLVFFKPISLSTHINAMTIWLVMDEEALLVLQLLVDLHVLDFKGLKMVKRKAFLMASEPIVSHPLLIPCELLKSQIEA